MYKTATGLLVLLWLLSQKWWAESISSLSLISCYSISQPLYCYYTADIISFLDGEIKARTLQINCLYIVWLNTAWEHRPYTCTSNQELSTLKTLISGPLGLSLNECVIKGQMLYLLLLLFQFFSISWCSAKTFDIKNFLTVCHVAKCMFIPFNPCNKHTFFYWNIRKTWRISL